ncbi:MAG: hypothetical protein CMI17_06875 [Opitutaceae bacterium]|nr:hypothetical protein [Opitutaceae bacterium]
MILDRVSHRWMIPRGVRLSLGNPGPAFRTSRMEEKNGKSGSTHSAHGVESSEVSFWPNMKGERSRRKPIAIIDRA